MFSSSQIIKDIEAGKFVNASNKKLAIDQIRMLLENAINPTKEQYKLAELHIEKIKNV